MRTSLIAAGANIVIIAALATLYGLLSNNPQLIGLGLSGIFMGMGVLGVASTPYKGPRESLNEIAKIMLNSHASIMESLDLLSHKIYVKRGDTSLLVISQAEPSENLEPGLGVARGSTYIAIPLNGIGEGITRLEDLSESSLRNTLSDLLTMEYQLASVVDISLNGDYLRITLLGVNEAFKKLQGYPLDPAIVLTLTALHRLTGKSLRLLNYNVMGDSVELRVKMVE